MPLYEFRCDSCGDFEAWRTLAEYSNPMHCPTCDLVARRIFSPPSVNLNSGSLPRGKEPRMIKRSPDPVPAKQRYNQQQGGRPWMISH